ncbi:MAG: hypothetical protein C0511_00885 [Hyphomicrobium sp.]|nr:hypothetical protein [Hyphomicrobium sp.]PPC84044.1 MAG: hypothetical protein CTY40_00885 [Hyphomicrobium sp.]
MVAPSGPLGGKLPYKMSFVDVQSLPSTGNKPAVGGDRGPIAWLLMGVIRPVPQHDASKYVAAPAIGKPRE